MKPRALLGLGGGGGGGVLKLLYTDSVPAKHPQPSLFLSPNLSRFAALL